VKCIGKKADGTNCKANAQKDFCTCSRHRDQEVGGEVAGAKIVDGGITSDRLAASTVVETATFESDGRSYSHVIRSDTTVTIDGVRVVKEPSIVADFINHKYTTSDPVEISVFRKYIQENPNNRRVWEI